jgi:hypothetical protein
MKLTIKQIVDKNYVRFVEYRKGILYYNVDATFKNHDKSI